MTDKAALRAIRRGDEEALALIIDRYGAYVGTVIHNIIGGSMAREDVEETTSDVFIALWRNAEQPQDAKLRQWLGAVARNKAKNKLRELGEELPLEEDYIPGALVDPEDSATEREERRIVRCAVLGMKPTDREIFLRHYYGLQPVAQVAESMRLNISTVKLRLLRGREKLRKTLEEGGFLE
jgi:RNA polymerase sigma-70 factor (ECF subfamily)